MPLSNCHVISHLDDPLVALLLGERAGVLEVARVHVPPPLAPLLPLPLLRLVTLLLRRLEELALLHAALVVGGVGVAPGVGLVPVVGGRRRRRRFL